MIIPFYYLAFWEFFITNALAFSPIRVAISCHTLKIVSFPKLFFRIFILNEMYFHGFKPKYTERFAVHHRLSFFLGG